MSDIDTYIERGDVVAVRRAARALDDRELMQLWIRVSNQPALKNAVYRVMVEKGIIR